MLDLNLASFLDHLTAMLADMPTEVVDWRPPMFRHARPDRQLAKAAAKLVAMPDGGILIALIRGGDRDVAGAQAAATRQIETIAPGAMIDVSAVPLVEGLAIAFQLRHIEPVRSVSGELDAIAGADLHDLDPGAVDVLRPFARRSEDDFMDVWTPDQRLLIDARGAVMLDEDAVPTVAGLVALGREPWRHVPGMRVLVRDGGARWVVGTARQLPGRVAQQLLLTGPCGDVVAELITNAIAHRDWSDDARHLPIEVHRRGREIDIKSPGAFTESATRNPHLRAMLRRRGIMRGNGDGLARAASALRGTGETPLQAFLEGDEARVRLKLPPRRVVSGPSIPTAHRSAPSASATKPRASTPPITPASASPSVAPSPQAPPTPTVAAPPAPIMVVAAPPAPTPTVAPIPKAAQEERKPPHMDTEERDRAVVELVRECGRVTTRDVIDRFGWTRSTTRDALARLVARRVLRQVAPARSPEQAYVLA